MKARSNAWKAPGAAVGTALVLGLVAIGPVLVDRASATADEGTAETTPPSDTGERSRAAIQLDADQR